MHPEQPHAATEVVRGVVAPDLVVRTRRSDHKFREGRAYRIGRDPESDIVMTDSRVSWKHGVLRVEGEGWVLEDAGSTNGTFLGARRVNRIEIGADCVVRLGNPDDGPILRFMPQLAPPLLGQRDLRPMPPADVLGDLGVMPDSATPDTTAPPDAPAGARDRAAARDHAAVEAVLPSVDRRPTQRMRISAEVLRIGRASSNDLSLAGDPEASRHHAELRKSSTGSYEIVDLGSHNGTFVNGERISRKVLTDRDLVSIGRSTFRLAGGELRQFVDEGEISFAADDLVVKVSGGKILLNHVTFPIPEKCLLGVIGPSGAGKSTLLGALTGMRPADTGTVLYDNRDLYRNYAELRHRIGLVPQESVLHTQLTARRALQYSAELRFPADSRRPERETRVDEVMGELGLTKHSNTRADRLSGGQLKRVNVAQELLTKPSLLFLDEPTSGLDPGLDKSVMEQMRDLAHDGRTVIVVTHSVANLDTCDRLLVLVPGGKIAFYGPPAEGLKYFGLPGWAEVFQAFERYPDRDWAAEYTASPAYQQYVAGQRPKPAAPAKRGPAELPAAPPPQRRGSLRQLSTLTRRYVRVISSDRGYLAFAALMPVILGALIRVFPSKEGLAGLPHTNGAAQELLLILAVCACLSGAALSVRELVKERTIYVRERAAGLSSGAYVCSKLLVLGVMSIIQSVLLVTLGLAGRKMPAQGAFIKGAPLLELLIGITVLALASMCLGLLVSALVGSSEKAMQFLVLLTMLQVILSGGALSLTGMAGLSQFSWIAPARWGFGAVAATVNLNVISPAAAGSTDPLWVQSSSNWLRDIGIAAGLAVFFALFAWLRMRRLGPGRRR
ncbi:MAG: FHA domain-containing protein [Streptosporangiaceae bacterium]|nr:FHA domain-containing protein [Streptosporangiaceae bacterium]